MSLVLDCSVAVAFTIESERTEAIFAMMGRVGDEGCVVPSLWRLEVANALQVAVKRRRITPEMREGHLGDLQALPIEVDRETDAHAWSDTLRLADQHGLTLYDAAYLELAARRGLSLASLDQPLCAAAVNAGVTVL